MHSISIQEDLILQKQEQKTPRYSIVQNHLTLHYYILLKRQKCVWSHSSQEGPRKQILSLCSPVVG